MPKLDFTDKELKTYFSGKYKSACYQESVDMYRDFLVHSDGIGAEHIIEKQRPNEPDNVKEFRKSIWQPITKPSFTKVLSSLSKIRRSSDWIVNYDKEKTSDFTLITDEETLEKYCEENFPYFTSLTNWTFSILLKSYAIDPNAVIFVNILEVPQENTYLRPYPFIIESPSVIEYVDEDYAVLRNDNGIWYEGEEHMVYGESYYIVTTEKIIRYDQVDSKRNFVATFEYKHNLGFMPVFKIGAVIKKAIGTSFIYESRIAGMLPNLNEAVAEYTDLQAAKRLHIYPERWEITQSDCTACNGIGLISNTKWTEGSNEPINLSCSVCNGHGMRPSNVYSKLLLKVSAAGETNLPNPPAGFIEKDVEIVKLMIESVDGQIYKALSAVNFQFLEQVPTKQSGVAKEVDKDELNNTVHSIAEDLVRCLDNIYYTIAAYRYVSNSLYAIEQVEEMLPSIPVPEHFDILSSAFMQEEIGKAKTSKLNPIIINEMEIEFAGKRFINQPAVKQEIELVLNLDPLPNQSADDKMSMLGQGGISKIDYVVSCNILAFVKLAMFEDKTFDEKPYDKQVEVMQKYAQLIIDANAEAVKMAQDLMKEEDKGEGIPAGDQEEDEEEVLETEIV